MQVSGSAAAACTAASACSWAHAARGRLQSAMRAVAAARRARLGVATGDARVTHLHVVHTLGSADGDLVDVLASRQGDVREYGAVGAARGWVGEGWGGKRGGGEEEGAAGTQVRR